MFKRIIIIGFSLLIAWGAAIAEELSGPVMLNPTATVSDDVIRLGDLFNNVGNKADIAVAYAPKYGAQTVFDASWLARAAQVHRLRWKPTSRLDRVVVEREAQRIEPDLIVTELTKALEERGMEGRLRVALDSRSVAMYLPPDAAPTVAVSDLRLNGRAQRFSATVSAPADQPAVRMTVYGKYFRIVEVPVLTQRMSRGSVIRKDHVTWAEMDSSRIRRDTVTDAEQLIGMATRRFVAPHVPVRSGDVQEPILVARGQPVTLVIKTPYMTLTVRGKALENGGKEDTVRVMNAHSQRIVEGTVIDADTVEIRDFGPVAVQSAG